MALAPNARQAAKWSKRREAAAAADLAAAEEKADAQDAKKAAVMA